MKLNSVKHEIKTENMRIVRQILHESFPPGFNKVYFLHIHAKYGLKSSVSVFVEAVYQGVRYQTEDDIRSEDDIR